MVNEVFSVPGYLCAGTLASTDRCAVFFSFLSLVLFHLKFFWFFCSFLAVLLVNLWTALTQKLMI